MRELKKNIKTKIFKASGSILGHWAVSRVKKWEKKRQKRINKQKMGKITKNSAIRGGMLPKTQKMQGKLTYISLLVAFLTVVFQALGKTFPQEEVNALVDFANSNWTVFTTIVALGAAAVGRARREWRQVDR